MIPKENGLYDVVISVGNKKVNIPDLSSEQLTNDYLQNLFDQACLQIAANDNTINLTDLKKKIGVY